MSKQKTATSGAKVRKTFVNVLIHIFLAILAFIWVLPVFWVVLTSFRAEKGSYVETFFPKTYTLNNYVKLFTDTSILNFPKMFMNTLILQSLPVSFQPSLYFQYLTVCQECVLK